MTRRPSGGVRRIRRDDRLPLTWLGLLLLTALAAHLLLGILFKPREFPAPKRIRAKRSSVIVPAARLHRIGMDDALRYFNPTLFLYGGDDIGFGCFRKMADDPRISALPLILPEVPVSSTSPVARPRLREASVPAIGGETVPVHLAAMAAAARATAPRPAAVRPVRKGPRVAAPDGREIGTGGWDPYPAPVIRSLNPSGPTRLRILPPLIDGLPYECEVVRSSGSAQLDLAAKRQLELLLAGDAFSTAQPLPEWIEVCWLSAAADTAYAGEKKEAPQ